MSDDSSVCIIESSAERDDEFLIKEEERDDSPARSAGVSAPPPTAALHSQKEIHDSLLDTSGQSGLTTCAFKPITAEVATATEEPVSPSLEMALCANLERLAAQVRGLGCASTPGRCVTGTCGTSAKPSAAPWKETLRRIGRLRASDVLSRVPPASPSAALEVPRKSGTEDDAVIEQCPGWLPALTDLLESTQMVCKRAADADTLAAGSSHPLKLVFPAADAAITPLFTHLTAPPTLGQKRPRGPDDVSADSADAAELRRSETRMRAEMGVVDMILKREGAQDILEVYTELCRLRRERASSAVASASAAQRRSATQTSLFLEYAQVTRQQLSLLSADVARECREGRASVEAAQASLDDLAGKRRELAALMREQDTDTQAPPVTTNIRGDVATSVATHRVERAADYFEGSAGERMVQALRAERAVSAELRQQLQDLQARHEELAGRYRAACAAEHTQTVHIPEAVLRQLVRERDAVLGALDLELKQLSADALRLRHSATAAEFSVPLPGKGDADERQLQVRALARAMLGEEDSTCTTSAAAAGATDSAEVSATNPLVSEATPLQEEVPVTAAVGITTPDDDPVDRPLALPAASELPPTPSSTDDAGDVDTPTEVDSDAEGDDTENDR